MAKSPKMVDKPLKSKPVFPKMRMIYLQDLSTLNHQKTRKKARVKANSLLINQLKRRTKSKRSPRKSATDSTEIRCSTLSAKCVILRLARLKLATMCC